MLTAHRYSHVGMSSERCTSYHFPQCDHVEVRCCLAREKCLHASPGDILVDDWDKHRKLWLKAGGIWIAHTSAADTGRQLTELGL